MTAPYCTDGQVTLYHGDCRDVLEWLTADVLVTDPPYGRNWRQGEIRGHTRTAEGIHGDQDTSIRDHVLQCWHGPAVVFGDLMLPPPELTKQVLVYGKPPDSGIRGALGGWRRDAEAIYLLGNWPSGIGGRSSVLKSGARMQGGAHIGTTTRYGHPHAKPVDVMETLIAACPPGIIADPFTGSGSTLVAARNQGRHAIGVEIDERYCELAARRLAQGTLQATS